MTEQATDGAAPSQKIGFFTSFTQATRRTRAGFRDVSHVLDVLRAPFFVSLMAVLIFLVPGQILEIYRLFAEDFSVDSGFTYDNLRFATFLFMLWLLGYVLWYVARVLTITDPKCKDAMKLPGGGCGATARWAPRLIGAAPAFAAALGMARAEFTRDGLISTPGLYGAAAVAAFIGFARLWASYRRTKNRLELYENIARSAFRVDVRVLFALVLLGGVAYLLTQPVAVTQTLGSLTILCFFMVGLVFGWAQLTYLYDHYAIPALSIMIGAVLLWSVLDINDNHFVRELPQDPGQAAAQQAKAAADLYGPAPPLTVQRAFSEWLASRADKPAYDAAGERYPVYVIAAQGGGLYAAYQAAMYMAILQDACPTFAQHVFAISGVSGGAIGSAAFAGLALEHARNQPIDSLDAPCGVAPTGPEGQTIKFTDKVETMLSQDFLSPVISGMLFGDFTARFSPAPIPAFDRARALERAFEDSWDLAHAPGEASRNRLEDGLLAYWTPTGVAPALFLNATEAETGRRMVFSPIEEVNDDMRTYAVAAAPRADGSLPDIRLSTASVVSARFPYITPAASLRLKSNPSADDGQGFRKIRLVDGGYFENTGIDTAFDILQAMRPARLSREERQRIRRQEGREALRARDPALRFNREIDLRVIVFDLTEDRFRDATYAFGEALTPIKAILNTRVSRSELAQSRVRSQLRAPCRYIFLGGARPPGLGFEDDDDVNRVCLPSQIAASRIWSVSLNDYEYDFQLGWILSKDTLARIRAQLGDPDLCRPGGASAPVDPALAATAGEGLKEQQQRLGFTDGVSVVQQDSEAPQTEDALARHNSCIATFVLDQLRIAPPPAAGEQSDAGPRNPSTPAGLPADLPAGATPG